ncbi:MAG: diguanylate cyclase [Burkholderiales bacterium]
MLVLLVACSAHGAEPGKAMTIDADTPMLDLRSRLDVWLDADGGASFESVEANPDRFGPISVRQGDDVNFGYRTGAVWLRFALKPGLDAPADWLLEVAYPPLDRVRVFVRGPDGKLVMQEAGDMLPFWKRPFPHRNLVFPLRFVPGAEYTVYLRVESEGNATIPVHVWQPAALAEHDRAAYSVLAFYYGLLFALVGFNLLIFISVRDSLYLLYVGMAVGMAIGQLSLNGFGVLWLWPESTKWANDALAWGFALCGLSGALFTRRFLETPRHTPLLDRILLLAAVVFAAQVLFGMVVPYRIFAIAVSLSGLGFSVVAVLAGVRCWSKGQAGAVYFLLAWNLVLAGTGVLAARNMGWLPTNALTTYAMQIGSALEMVLFSFALADRINRLRREKEAAQAEALASGEAMVAALKRSEAELDRRVRERTLELALANRRLMESAAKHRMQASHDALTGLANRMLLDDRLDRAIEHARRCGTRVGLVMIDLDHFKPVNDTHGHAVGDRLLVVTAARLREAVRTSDTVARYGGDEFVLIIENVRDREDVERVLGHIQRRLSSPVNEGSLQLSLSASMGVSVYPDDAPDASALLRRADEAMYAAKKARKAQRDDARRSVGIAA